MAGPGKMDGRLRYPGDGFILTWLSKRVVEAFIKGDTDGTRVAPSLLRRPLR